MKNLNFSISVMVNARTNQVFEKIAKVNEWWAKDFSGKASNLNDCFTIRFGKTFVDFSIAEAVPNLKYVWLVTDCELPWLIDKKGWNNTRIVFEIYQENNQTKIVFTHIGLVPGIECYENCVKGWTRFVTISLPKFLDEGQGLPE